MSYLYLLCAMCCSSLLSIMSSLFGRRNEKSGSISTLYSLIVTTCAFVSWGLLFLFDPEFELSGIGYSMAYGLFYMVAQIGMFKAYQYGSVSLTAFVKQLSLIGVAFWGFVFWENPLTQTVSMGLVLIVVSLYLCLKNGKNSVENKVSLKWGMFALMLLVGNAGCSIIQKYHQMAFDGRCGSQLMFLGVGFSAIACMILYVKGDRVDLRKISKSSLVYPVVGGMSSAGLTLFTLLLIRSTLSESIIFPGIAVGGLIFTTLFSIIVYREKLDRRQWIGLGIGAAALVFLNI